MDILTIGIILLVVILVIVLLVFLSYYNKIIRLENRIDNSWAQIDVQLKRRADLIPNLMETVKGYMKHEKEVLENVTKARSAIIVRFLNIRFWRWKASCNCHLLHFINKQFFLPHLWVCRPCFCSGKYCLHRKRIRNCNIDDCDWNTKNKPEIYTTCKNITKCKDHYTKKQSHKRTNNNSKSFIPPNMIFKH